MKVSSRCGMKPNTNLETNSMPKVCGMTRFDMQPNKLLIFILS